MIKYVANSLFATMISFSNEIANICSAIPNVDARRVWEGVHLDRRLTPLPGRRPAGRVDRIPLARVGFRRQLLSEGRASAQGVRQAAGPTDSDAGCRAHNERVAAAAAGISA